MKQVYIFLIYLLLSHCIFAQALLHIENGALLSSSGTSMLTLNNAKMENNGTVNATSGVVLITGNATAANSSLGGGSCTINNLTLDKSANNAQLSGNITVKGNITLTNGNLDVNGYTINLDTTGAVQNEDNTHRVYSSNGNGSITRTVTLNAPTASNPGNLGLQLTSTQNLGVTTITRNFNAVSRANGTTSILRNYQVTPANNSGLNAEVRVNYLENELNNQVENTLQVWTGLPWQAEATSTREVNNNYVSFSGANSLNMISVGAPSPSLTVSLVSPPAFYCAGNIISVNYASTSLAFNAGNTVSLQLSDAAGSFSNPVVLKTVTTTSNSGTISANLPFATVAGMGYKVRVVSSNTAFVGTANNTAFEVRVSTVPAPTISYTGGITANQNAINLNPAINILITGCQGANIVLTANNTGGNPFQWWKNGVNIAGSENQATLTVNISWGDYQLVTTDVNGCGSAADTVGINLKPTPVANGGLDRNICQGTTTTIGAAAQANTTYTWTPSTHLSSATAANPTVLATLPATTTYNLQIARSYTVLDANFTCSSAIDPVLVTLKPQPAAPSIAANNTAVCQGTNITVTASNVVGSIKWYADNVAAAGANPLTISSTSGSTKVYTAKNLGANGCLSVASNALSLTVRSAPTPTITSSVGTDVSNVIKVCPGITSAILSASASAGTPTYTWFNPPNASSIGTGNTFALTNIATANKSYYVRATYVYGGLTCMKQSITKTIRQDATATGCRVMQSAEETLESTLIVYPNPTENQLNAEIQVAAAGDGTLTLINDLGQSVWSEQRSFEVGNTNIQLTLETLPAGIYFLTLEKGEERQTVSVVKE